MKRHLDRPISRRRLFTRAVAGTAILLILGVVLAACSPTNAPRAAAAPQAATAAATVSPAALTVDVDKFAGSARSYLGLPVKLKGVVSFVYPENHMIVVIDNQEYANCGVVTCAITQVPVLYSGPLPKVKDYIIASGSLRQGTDGKMVFEASELNTQ